MMDWQDDPNNPPSIDDVVREMRRRWAADNPADPLSIADALREMRRQANPTGHPLDPRGLTDECSTPEPIYPSWIETQPMYENIQRLTQPVRLIEDHYMPEPPPDPIEEVNDNYSYDRKPPPPEPFFPQSQDWNMSSAAWVWR